MIEVFRDIPGYEGLYQVSNLGNVKSLGNGDNNSNVGKERMLKLQKDKDGYLTVFLSIHNYKKLHKVHRLVAQAFLPNPNNYPQINHKDKNRSNNNVDNLEWCTAQYNADYSVSKPVNQYSLDGIYIATYKSIKEASRKTGTDQTGIVDCCKGRLKTSGGFIWKYVN